MQDASCRPGCVVVRLGRLIGGALVLLLVTAFGTESESDSSSQLAAVRSRIGQLERQLTDLQRQQANARAESVRLDAELELAEARVHEIEIQLGDSRDAIVSIRAETVQLAEELELRRAALKRHLEMVTLLGRPGPLQLFYDAVRGGELDQAVSTVAVLTAAQLRLVEEYESLQAQRTASLASLSQRMELARREAAELVDRRQQLALVQQRVENELKRLQRSQKKTGDRLAEMRSREQALEHLLEVVRSRSSFTGKRNIREFRGALPWPADGEVVRTYGKHYLPKYTTYTVCNGLRLQVAGGAEVQAIFPGEVAYARHFKGYGNMVVVDHGHGVYSLVAGLATIHVRVGQRVAMGKRLGLTPPPDDDGNLYLEIRVGEKPQDPRRWLLLEEGRS